MDLFDIIFSMGEKNDSCGNTTVGDYIIDTCHTFDCGYETAIIKVKGKGDMIITQRYETREEAVEGHALWIEYCKLFPIGAYSVQTKHIELF